MKQAVATLLGKIVDIVALDEIVGFVKSDYCFCYTNDKFLGFQVREYLEAFVKNANALLPNLHADFSDEIMVLRNKLHTKYPNFKKRTGNMAGYTDYAVIYVDKMQQLKDIKGDIQRQGMGEYRDFEDWYIDDEFKTRCQEEHTDEGIQPKFNPPRHRRKNTYLAVTCDLLGCCTLMSENQLEQHGISDIKGKRRCCHHRGSDIEDIRYDEPNIPMIVLCKETLKELAASYRKDSQSSKYKQEVGEKFGIGLGDFYFDKRAVDILFVEGVDRQYHDSVIGTQAEYLTFAHEFAHLILGHLYGSVKLWINRETQANFLASILINDPIASIYMQYKTCFQPMEYQRTILLYNDFNVANITKVLRKVLILK